MDSIKDQLGQLTILSSGCDNSFVRTGKVAALVDTLQQKASAAQNDANGRQKTAPSIPPKPYRKTNDMPQVPLSRLVTDTQEPLYSQPLQSLDLSENDGAAGGFGSILHRKQIIHSGITGDKSNNSQTTLDNPAVLEQQLEALAYHKLQMERKGLLGATKSNINIPKLSSTSLSRRSLVSPMNSIYNNLPMPSDKDDKRFYMPMSTHSENDAKTFYSNVQQATSVKEANHADVGGPTKSLPRVLSICTQIMPDKELDEELPPPPSPVSSSYSELRRATDVFNKPVDKLPPAVISNTNFAGQNSVYKNYQTKASGDYYGYGGQSQSSSTYDSIYEPINPRPPSDMSTRNNYNIYAYQNQLPGNVMNEVKTMSTSRSNTPVYCPQEIEQNVNYPPPNKGDENLRQYHLNSIDSANEVESYGRCFKCGERVLGENSGCTAMDQIYHIDCFTCTECQINLQGKPFYALDGVPFCEHDYLQTLEKCSVCLKPILERILRATGKPYHPKCFTCVVCGNSLDAIPFTVDATNQNYCIADFHKKFAPRCCVCKQPIMPELGQEETVRVVALDRSFHLECYKCEDCSLLLSSEADGRGCYPLDDHIFCKSCNARRVQALTNRMTSEL